MSNQVSTSGKTAAIKALLETATVKLVLLDSADYTYDTAHAVLSDVASLARVAISPALTGKTFVNGTFDADDVTLPLVSGDSVECAWIYIDTGTESTSTLLSYHDGLTLVPSGSNVKIVFNASGIFTY